MEEKDGMFEHFKGEDGKERIKISKVPLEDLLNILENLYEQGVNFVDFDFIIDPKEDQSVISISTKPEYISTPEELEVEKLLYGDDEDEDDEDEEDDVLARIRKEQKELESREELSDDDIDQLLQN